jgi:predicted Ser/Thr protein kinase
VAKPDGEALYDRYLDAWLAGEGEAPDRFLARHPDLGEEWRERIRRLHDVLTEAGDADAGRPPFERLGGYRLLRRIGGGGMGTVFLAEQEGLRRLVALKLIRPELQASKTALQRFEREAKAVARLRHPNVVRVLELGEDQGAHFLAMEYVPGRPLAHLVAEERPHVSRVLRWTEELAHALHDAHAHRIVHRDVKPNNILITPEDRAVLLDFGMAHLRETAATRLTRSFAGSPSYAAPEQLADGAPVDARTDVYGLGATLYECLTGRPPFDGESVEAILAKVMRDEPVAPRRLDAAIPADVETVTLKALAKRPADRYIDAAAFADDLRALREARRIVARRPSAGARLRAWARRHPARATAAGAALAGLLAFGVLLLVQARARELKRRRDARVAVDEAGRRVTRYREDRIRSAELMERYVVLQDRTEDSYLTDEQDRELDEVSAQVDDLRRRRAAEFHEVLSLLERARQLDPDVGGVDAVRARLYLEKFEEAFQADDFVTADFYRDLVLQLDPAGELTAGWRRPATITLRVRPADAAVYLFRDVEMHRRYVPVPDPGAPHPLLERGGLALRVVRGAGDLAAGDTILTLDGHPVEAAATPGQTARVYRLGREFEAEVPPGLVARRTAAPLLPRPACRVRAGELSLAPGVVRFLCLREGYEPVVFPLQLGPAARHELHLALSREGETPDGFVRIPQGPRNPAPYSIQEREVTCAEYLEFLNAPETRSAIDATDGLVLVPRGPQSVATGGDWPLGEDGYRLPADWSPDWPVIGVSFRDAQAYARWRSLRDGRVYALPTRHEWTFAAGAYLGRPFVFGRVWRPKWVNSCYSRPHPAPEPVLSYPVDESAFGVFDLSGSVAEWMDDWFDEARGMRRLGGSSWGHTEADLFRIWGGDGAVENAVSHTYGFRLVIRA